MQKHIVKYAIECALIFISVIAAFLVDNLQERSQQKAQELNLLRDVRTDLVKDTMLIHQRVESGNAMSNDLTKLIKMLQRADRRDTIDDYALKYSNSVFLNKTTYESIKNTGGFKFITDRMLVNDLSDYYDNREEWTEFCSTEVGNVEDEISAYLRAHTKFVDLPVPEASGAISYTFDPGSLAKMKGDQELINLCYDKRAKTQLMTFLMDSLKKAGTNLNRRCEEYLKEQD